MNNPLCDGLAKYDVGDSEHEAIMARLQANSILRLVGLFCLGACLPRSKTRTLAISQYTLYFVQNIEQPSWPVPWPYVELSCLPIGP